MDKKIRHHKSQRPRCKQQGIKFAAQRAAGYLTPRAVAKCTCKHVRSARCLRENKRNQWAVIIRLFMMPIPVWGIHIYQNVLAKEIGTGAVPDSAKPLILESRTGEADSEEIESSDESRVLKSRRSLNRVRMAANRNRRQSCRIS